MEFVPVVCHIPELLRRIGKTQRWLADKTRMSEQRISDIVNLRIKNIRLATAMIIASTIGCRVEDLFTWGWRQKK